MLLDKIGIGVDVEEIARFEKYDAESDFAKKVYTKKELEYCFKNKQSAKHLAVRFCAKEAVYKALSSLGFSGISFQDCEVRNLESGAPEVVFLSQKLKNVRAKISLSHSKTTAVAQVVAELVD